MAICNTACAPALPAAYTAGCKKITRKGGIKFFAFIKCDYEFEDVASRTEWAAAILAGNVVLTGKLLAQKPKGSFTKKRTASCEPESVVGAEKTITFQDYNTDTVTAGGNGVLAYDFWNTILADPSSYKFGWYTCDNRFYGPVDDFQIEVDEVEEESNNDSIFFDGTISFNQVSMVVPVAVDLNGL